MGTPHTVVYAVAEGIDKIIVFSVTTKTAQNSLEYTHEQSVQKITWT